MYDTILIPTDGSECAERAIAMGLAFAEKFDASLHAVYIIDRTMVPSSAEAAAEEMFTKYGKQALSVVDERAATAGVRATTEIVQSAEGLHETIIEHARDHDADLIVMGSHGRTGLSRIALGSVAARTIRDSPIPVLTVKQIASEAVDRILLPVDGSRGAVAAATHAIELALETNAALHVLHVIDVAHFSGEFDSSHVYDAFERIGQEAVDDVIERAEQAGVTSIESTIVNGRPGRSIAEYATEQDIDLIVMGTHGRSGIDHYLLGSVAEAVARIADPPVLTINVGDD